jgi:hypothetical protein
LLKSLAAKNSLEINLAFLLQYVVVPTRRGTAEAIQILFSHLFGDAGSPYLIGTVSPLFKFSLAFVYLSANKKKLRKTLKIIKYFCRSPML